MVKARGEGRPIKLELWGDLPPGKVPERDIEATFPQANYVDRSEPREPSEHPQGNIMTRHRILRADDAEYQYFSQPWKGKR